MTDEGDQEQTFPDGAEMLRRIGWHPSDWKQIEIYARMPPARKIEQMFRLRHSQMQVLRRRLEQEHPGLTKVELARLLQEHLDLVRDDKTHNVGI
jgi:hypothetical protein